MHNPNVSEIYAGTAQKTDGGVIKWTGKINTVESALEKPLSWKKPYMVFVNSMSDLFHPDIPIEFLDKIFDVIKATPRHTYQILTKRPELVNERLPINWGDGWDNVWIGTSVEDERVKHRIDTLSKIPAKVRFVSFEPLIGPVSVSWTDMRKIHWAIIGGESGPNARPCEPRWINKLRHDLVSAKVPVFIKQMGGDIASRWKLSDKKGGKIEEWPTIFQYREMPNVA